MYFENTGFDLLNYTVSVSEVDVYTVGFNVSMSQAIVTLKLRRQSSYYTIMFIIPSTLVTMMALFGWPIEEIICICAGMYTPDHSTREREHKVDIGLTALLTMCVVLLSLGDMLPKTPMGTFPWLGLFLLSFTIYTRSPISPCVSSLHANGAHW